MKKRKFYGKILLACMMCSYLQLIGSVGLVLANDLPSDMEPMPVIEVPEEPSETEPLELPDVEILAEEGVLKFNLLREEVEEDTSEFSGEYEVEWYEVIPTDNDEDLEEAALTDEDSEELLLVSSDGSYMPKKSGLYEVRVWTVDEFGEKSESYLSAKYEVEFPILDDLQFENLSYRAGELFLLEYADEWGFADLFVAAEDEDFLVDQVEDVWTVTGPVLYKEGVYELEVTAISSDGFSTFKNYEYAVEAGVVSSEYSTLSVMVDGEEVDYIEAGSGELDVEFTAHDDYENRIPVSTLDSVKVRLNGELLEGANYLGDSTYTVERTAKVPDEENVQSSVIVDVFSEECEGTLAGEVGYCFSKIKTFVVYDTFVEPVSELVYLERTSESFATIFGTKLPGYGVKVNSVDSKYVVAPDSKTSFRFDVPLAEGVNGIKVFSVKEVSEELIFYSDPEMVVIEKDTKVSAPVWREVPITLDGDNQATLHWVDPIYLTDTDYDFSHVNIYRSTVPNFVPSEDNLVVQTHNPSWTDTGLTTGTTYYYVVEAVDDLGNTEMIASVESTGEVLGEAATVAAEQVWYEDLFVGKGEYEEEDSSDEYVEPEAEDVEEEETEGVAGKVSELFNKAKKGSSDFAKKLFDNIFVQIIFGGVIIFLGLMLLISVLVWLKERVVTSSLSLGEVDKAMKKGKSTSGTKSRRSKRKSKSTVTRKTKK